MRREISWGEEALAELETFREQEEGKVAGRGSKLVAAVDAMTSSLIQFPLQGSPVDTRLEFANRRVRLKDFGIVLFYFVYPR